MTSKVVRVIAFATSTGSAAPAFRHARASTMAEAKKRGTNFSKFSYRKAGATASLCHRQSAPSARNSPRWSRILDMAWLVIEITAKQIGALTKHIFDHTWIGEVQCVFERHYPLTKDTP